MRRPWIIDERKRKPKAPQPELRPHLDLPIVAPTEEDAARRQSVHSDEDGESGRGVAVIDFYI